MKTDELLIQVLDKVNEIKVDTKDISDRLNSLENRLTGIEEKVSGIDTRLGNLETRFNNFDNKLPQITEKFGELKNWRQIAIVILAAFVSWIARGNV